jgi:hypothetical protein
MLADAGQPCSADLLDALEALCKESRVWNRVLVGNPEALYGF